MNKIYTSVIKYLPEITFNNINIASAVANEVVKVANSKNSIIIEGSPGNGFVTSQLIKSNASRVIVLEQSNSPHIKNLQNLLNNTNAHLYLLKNDRSYYHGISQICQKRSIDGLQFKNKQEVTCLIPLHPKHEKFCLSLIMSDLVKLSGFFSHEIYTNEAFIVISNKLWKNLNSEKTLYSKILYNTLFSFDTILNIDWKNFSPEVKFSRMKKIDFDTKICHLVKLRANEETLRKIDPSLLIEYQMFLRQILVKRKSPLLPFIE